MVRGKHHIHYIITLDGICDHFLPGRWKAFVNTLGVAFAEGHGPTEQAAIDDLRARLREKFPDVPWYAQLPAIHLALNDRNIGPRWIGEGED